MGHNATVAAVLATLCILAAVLLMFARPLGQGEGRPPDGGVSAGGREAHGGAAVVPTPSVARPELRAGTADSPPPPEDLDEPPLDAGAVFTVVLSGAGGEPVLEADVKIERATDDADGEVECERNLLDARETGGGRYTFERIDRGEWYLYVCAEGHEHVEEYFEFPETTRLQLDLEVGLDINGIVFSLDGSPVEGATITVEEYDAGLYSRRSDGSGAFLLTNLGADEYSVVVDADGFAPASRYVEAGRDGVEFRLFREAVLSGTVRAGDDGAPIDRVRIEADGPRDVLSDCTGAAGTFEIRGMAPGEYRVRVCTTEYLPPEPFSVHVEEGDAVSGLDIELSRGLVREMLVLDRESREPVAKARVHLSAKEGRGRSTTGRTATTNAEGLCRVSGLLPGRYDASVTACDYVVEEPVELVVTARDSAPFVLVLRRGGFLSGRVLDPEGDRVEGAHVYLEAYVDRTGQSEGAGPIGGRAQSRSTVLSVQRLEWRWPTEFHWRKTTGVDGAYSFGGLPTFEGYAIYVVHDEFVPSRTMGIAVKVGEVRDGVDVSLSRGGSIAGEVVDPQGEPIERATVWVEATTPRDHVLYGSLRVLGGGHVHVTDRTVETGRDGTFRLGPLRPGCYDVNAAHHERLRSAPVEVSVLEGKVTPRVYLTLSEGNALVGQVVSTNGTPILGASVSVELPRQSYSLETTTDRDGWFRMPGLPAGTVSVDAWCPGFSHAERKATVPGLPVELRLHRSGRVLGRVVARGRGWFPEGYAWLDVWSPRTRKWSETAVVETDATGRFDLYAPPGRHILTVGIEGFSTVRRELEISAGEIREVEIDMDASARLEGRVHASDSGVAVSGARVIVTSSSGLPTSTDAWDGSADEEKTEEDGTFVRELSTGPYSVIVLHEEYRTARVEGVWLRARETREQTIELVRDSGVRGRVSVEGWPVAAAQVAVWPEEAAVTEGHERVAHADRSGFYEVAGLNAGRYTLRVRAWTRPGRVLETGTALNVPNNGFEWRAFDLAGTRLFGRVLSAGKPLPHTTVQVASGEDSWRGELESDSEGRYAISLPSPGTYRLRVTADGCRNLELELAVAEGVVELHRDLVLAR